MFSSNDTTEPAHAVKRLIFRLNVYKKMMIFIQIFYQVVGIRLPIKLPYKYVPSYSIYIVN